MPKKGNNAERAENESGQVLFHGAGTFKPLGLQEEFHFDTGNFNYVMVLQQMRLGIKRFTIYNRELSTFNMRNEISVRPFGNDSNLHPRLA
jgi:hypothetical protein